MVVGLQECKDAYPSDLYEEANRCFRWNTVQGTEHLVVGIDPDLNGGAVVLMMTSSKDANPSSDDDLAKVTFKVVDAFNPGADAIHKNVVNVAEIRRRLARCFLCFLYSLPGAWPETSTNRPTADIFIERGSAKGNFAAGINIGAWYGAVHQFIIPPTRDKLMKVHFIDPN